MIPHMRFSVSTVQHSLYRAAQHFSRPVRSGRYQIPAPPGQGMRCTMPKCSPAVLRPRRSPAQTTLPGPRRRPSVAVCGVHRPVYADDAVSATSRPGGGHSMFVVVRHAHAVGKTKWRGAETNRPLSALGRRQAVGIVAALDGIELHTLFSSPTVRCRDTLEPHCPCRTIGRWPRTHRSISSGWHCAGPTSTKPSGAHTARYSTTWRRSSPSATPPAISRPRTPRTWIFRPERRPTLSPAHTTRLTDNAPGAGAPTHRGCTGSSPRRSDPPGICAPAVWCGAGARPGPRARPFTPHTPGSHRWRWPVR